MSENDEARTRREAQDATKPRRAAGTERRLSGLRSYLAAILYAEERDPYDEQRDRRSTRDETTDEPKQ